MGSNGRAAVAPESPSPMTEPAGRGCRTTADRATRRCDRTASVDPSRSARPRAVEVDREEVLVLDFGGQYSQLIARRIRECGVFAELLPHDTDIERISERAPRGAGALRRAGLGLRRRARRRCAPSCSSSASRCWASVTGCRRWSRRSAAGSRAPSAASSAAPSSRCVDERRPPARRACPRAAVLDEPPRLRLRAAAGLHRARLEPRLAGRRLRGHRARALRDPVPPRGRPHAVRHGDPRPASCARSPAAGSSGRRPR